MKNKLLIILFGCAMVGATFLYSLAQEPSESIASVVPSPVVSANETTEPSKAKTDAVVDQVINSTPKPVTSTVRNTYQPVASTPIPTPEPKCNDAQRDIYLIEEEAKYSQVKFDAGGLRQSWVNEAAQNSHRMNQNNGVGVDYYAGIEERYADLLAQLEAKHQSNVAKINSTCY